MRYLTSLFIASTAVSALSATAQNPLHQDVLGSTEQYLLEIEPGNTKWVTEEEKWELKRV